jgi:hypothetical protein
MPNGMDDDFGLGRLIENEIGIRRRRHSADGRIVRAGADIRMRQQKIDDELNARLNVPGALRRMSRDVVEERSFTRCVWPTPRAPDRRSRIPHGSRRLSSWR